MRLVFVQKIIDKIRRKRYDEKYNELRETLNYLSACFDIDSNIMQRINKYHKFPQFSLKSDLKVIKQYIHSLDASKVPRACGQLRNYQIQVLNLAKEIIPTLEEQNIRTILVGGTLLGAVRHQGFIPWDDDADFDLMRDDYNKLRDFVKENYPYFERDTFENYTDFYMDLNTLLKEYPNQIIFSMKTNGICAYRGTSLRDVVSLDFFPRDYINDNLTEKTYLDYINKRKKNKKFSTWREYYEFIDDAMKDKDIFPKHSSKTAKGWGSYAINYLNRGVVIDVDKLFPLKKIQFEDTEFYTVADPDNYLRVMYGENYNSLPTNIVVAKTVADLTKIADMCDNSETGRGLK